MLKEVDEFTLFCFYLEYDPIVNVKYSSPVREGDANPSFTLFQSNTNTFDYLWKDHATGQVGTIFTLISILFGITLKQAYAKVNTDFALGLTGAGDTPTTERVVLPKKEPVIRPNSNIRIKSKSFTAEDLAYWENFHISTNILQIYNVKAVDFVWYFEDQVYPKKMYGLAFSYRIGSHFKIYRPFIQKEFKFRNDYPSDYIEGFDQLEYKTNLLIITKSLKDVMVLKELGYEAVSPKGENIPIPNKFIVHFKSKYKTIKVLFDNDMKHGGDKLPFELIYVPLESKCKDISDYIKMYGKEKTVALLKQILNETSE